MLDADSGDSATVRATYFIDPAGIVRALTWYPMTNGRSVEEMLRLLAALQATDATGDSTLAEWRPGAPLLRAPPLTVEDARDRPSDKTSPWYFRRASK